MRRSARSATGRNTKLPILFLLKLKYPASYLHLGPSWSYTMMCCALGTHRPDIKLDAEQKHPRFGYLPFNFPLYLFLKGFYFSAALLFLIRIWNRRFVFGFLHA